MTTTQYGGKVMTTKLLHTAQNGRVKNGHLIQKKKLLILTQDLQLLLVSAHAFHLNGKILQVYLSVLLSSVADVLRLLHWYISHLTGTMVYSLAQQWLLKQQLLQQVQLVL